ncbi:thiamine phosphate synthase [Alteribacillus sp. HJP-4]|uniref:thiamine phosphate synthase n=1 Tax=Alteribacillus sp. HJP-4 TaxID=2775394 RepID=UPI0035CCD4C9
MQHALSSRRLFPHSREGAFFRCGKGGLRKVQLHAISSGNQSIEKWHEVTLQTHHYVDFVHIREKKWSRKDIEAGIRLLLQSNVPKMKIIVNNQPELVEKYNLGGIHYPEHSPIRKLTGKVLHGASVHSVTSAVEKEKQGADYLFFGHVFASSSKQGVAARGLMKLQEVTAAVNIPVIAIGGMTKDNLRKTALHGAKGAAVLSGIYYAENPGAEAAALRKEGQN